jgi:hypothetical protein
VLRLALVLGLGLAYVAAPAGVVVATAHAQPNPGGFVPNDAPPPASTMRKPEQLTGRPSGFWTSTRPALGSRYRWRIMGMGLLAAAIMAFFVVRMLRRASAARART